jgi:hypothetical protein
MPLVVYDICYPTRYSSESVRAWNSLRELSYCEIRFLIYYMSFRMP